MNDTRWQYRVIEYKPSMMGRIMTDDLQGELDKLGLQGWELVSLTPTMPLNHLVAVLKRGA